MSKKGRICMPLWLVTLALMAALTASERVRRRNNKAKQAEKRDDGE
jgi:hypothetical protein